jgi:anti-anti-sigma factor
MKHTLENKVLTLFLEGELNSYNAEEVEREIEGILEQGQWSSIVIDMEHLRYISSAGLRIIVRLKQRCDDTSIVKVSDGVYDVFEMVGFNSLMKIEKL